MRQLHSNLPREGPGDDATTRSVLLSLDLPQAPKVLDVGCGPGAQSLVLASESGGTVTAVDVHQPFLDELERRAANAGLDGRISTCRATMSDLPFADGAFDLIWSEGAIFIMGFGAGLTNWRRLLRRGGFLVASEATWLDPEISQVLLRPRAAFDAAHLSPRERAILRLIVDGYSNTEIAAFALSRARSCSTPITAATAAPPPSTTIPTALMDS